MRALRVREDGSVMVIMVLILTVLAGMIGFAIDSSRAYSVKQRLQEALDAAALVGARNYVQTDRDNQIRSYFNANWRQGYLRSDTPILSITTDDTTQEVLITASVNMPTVFMKLIGAASQVRIGAMTRTIRGEQFLEIALALDNTHSMAYDITGNIGSAPNRRIDLVKAAAKAFVRSLYTDGGGLQDTIPNMWLSVVPFSSVVNVGQQNGANILAPGSLSNIKWWSFPYYNDASVLSTADQWRGCVFERSFYAGGSYHGRDMTDDSPATERFLPYYVSLSRYEVFPTCSCDPPAAPTPPPPPSPPAPPAPPAPPGDCSYEGFPCSLKKDATPQTPLVKASFGEKAPASAPNPLLKKTGGGCTPGQTIWWDWWRTNTISQNPSNSNIRPIFTYDTEVGIIDVPSIDGVTTPGYLRDQSGDLPGLGQFKPYSLNTLAAMCGPGSDPTTSRLNFVELGWITGRGRWILPYPYTSAPVLGGWGNSGCGLPLTPLAPGRLTIEAAINAMDVPPGYKPNVPSGTMAPLGTAGTLINQGLVWGWRTVSPNWRGVWKDSGGTPISGSLPRDYQTQANHNTKAVVVLTDGLNFIPYPFINRFRFTSAWDSYGGIGAGSNAGFNMGWATDCTGGCNDVQSYVDNSAYGLLFDDWWSQTRYDACIRRKNLGPPYAVGDYMQPYGLTEPLDCRMYECMLRDTNGRCVISSGSGETGPYYDELERRMLQTCTNMKANNVRIFFIVFAVNNNPLKARAMAAFNDCVGTEGAVYDAADAADLQQAFSDITARVRKLQILQ